MGGSRAGEVLKKYMKVEYKETAINIIVIIFLIFMCGLFQFVCDLDKPDVQYIEE